MNELIKFENELMGNVRGVNINGEAYLVGSDLVEALKYDLTNNSYSKYIKQYVDDEDYFVYNKDYCEKVQNRLIQFDYKDLGRKGGYLVNESGFYALVFGSKLPEAKKFKRWVTSEVLPMIRKTGGYVSNEDMFIETYMSNMDEGNKLIVKQILLDKKEEHRKHLEQVNKLNSEINQKVMVIDSLTNDIDSTVIRKIGVDYIRKSVVCSNDRDYAKVWNKIYSMLGTVLKMDLNYRKDKYVAEVKQRVNANKEINKIKGYKGIDKVHPCSLKEGGLQNGKLSMIGYICDVLKEGHKLLEVMAKLFDVGIECVIEKYNFELENADVK